MPERYHFAYRFRGVLMAPPYLFMCCVFLKEWEVDAIIWPLGLMVFGLGVALRIWAQMHLHYRLSVHKQLTTTGPYRWTRNPIYLANATMLLGLTVLSELLWFLLVMLLWCAVVYYFVVRREEAHLLEKYGEPYAQYLARVPRWAPQLPPRRKGAAGAAGFLLPSIRAEVNCLLLLIPLVGKEVIPHLFFLGL